MARSLAAAADAAAAAAAASAAAGVHIILQPPPLPSGKGIRSIDMHVCPAGLACLSVSLFTVLH